jgi:hypothetical protein
MKRDLLPREQIHRRHPLGVKEFLRGTQDHSGTAAIMRESSHHAMPATHPFQTRADPTRRICQRSHCPSCARGDRAGSTCRANKRDASRPDLPMDVLVARFPSCIIFTVSPFCSIISGGSSAGWSKGLLSLEPLARKPTGTLNNTNYLREILTVDWAFFRRAGQSSLRHNCFAHCQVSTE